MAMPEATMDKNNRAVLGENDVWIAGQFLVFHPIAESMAPEGVSQLQLRLLWSGVNMGHSDGTFLLCHVVGHVGECLTLQRYVKQRNNLNP